MKKLKRLTALILALVLCAGMMGYASAADMGNFTDVNPSAWYYEAVSEAVDNGLLIGKGEGILDPQGSLTRAEMAAVINRAFGAYVEGDLSRFTDVPKDKWYYGDMAMAWHMGTYVGAGEDTMAPEADITRQEAMAVVARALQLNLEDYGDTDLSAFADAGAISGWALPYVRAMVGAGYIQGWDSKLFPRDAITRAEFAQVFANIIGAYLTEPGTYTQDYEGNLLVRTDDVTLKDLTVYGDLILGCGAVDGAVTLDNVTVTGRVVVWGGGTNAVWMDNGTAVADLIVCRVDNPVKVIFDRDSTLKVYDKIDVTITDRAEAFEETEVLFYDISGILGEQDQVNGTVEDRQIVLSIPAHLFATVGDTALPIELVNGSEGDTYQVELRRDDTGELAAEPVTLTPNGALLALRLVEPLPMGDYPCTATVTATRDSQVLGTVDIAVTIHSGYLWNL
ncbi:MAG TPA: S-layer homology domain-containing protein [Candidatus Enterenecus stercoripullorum]|nr:S-layer homology domain-containing protein [Candidatus Enterenecus stercoripullorum]